ncbi:hypothetical protein [Tetragenococcus halophilus]|uniref:hypothetical protein n=1 Tax=Tetragenococcus halophilus TaxID=51669 RepID=UPI0030F2F4BD
MRGVTVKKDKNTYTIEEVFDYISFLNKHQARWGTSKSFSGGKRLKKKDYIYNRCMRKTVAFYLSKLQAGRPPKLKTLFKHYLKLWDEATGSQEVDYLKRDPRDTTWSKRRSQERYVQEAYEVIQKFYEKNKVKRQAIVSVNYPYVIEIDGIKITGTFELIREVVDPMNIHNRVIEVVSYITNTSKPEQHRVETDLYSSFISYAFLKTFHRYPDELIIHNVTRDEEKYIDQEGNNYQRLAKVLKGFAQFKTLQEETDLFD